MIAVLIGKCDGEDLAFDAVEDVIDPAVSLLLLEGGHRPGNLERDVELVDRGQHRGQRLGNVGSPVAQASHGAAHVGYPGSKFLLPEPLAKRPADAQASQQVPVLVLVLFDEAERLVRGARQAIGFAPEFG